VARLRRSDSSTPGIKRRGRGRGFEYLDEQGNRIEDEEVLERIRELAIPPAWKDVWICPYPMGHIQAVGVDAAGRKQYRYHQKWRERRDQEKFDEMIDFARALPRMRSRIAEALDRDDSMDAERVLAAAVRLLDRGFFRVGGEDYAVENETYGLATMEKRHAHVDGDLVTFDYTAKSGKRRVQSLKDPQVAPLIERLKRRRGPAGDDLLAHKHKRHWSDIRSDDINAYVKQVTGGDFSAKDFRTWGATVLAAQALAVSGPVADSKSGRKRAITRAVNEVAYFLGNTPAVCRASYIDPRVFDRYAGGLTIAGVIEEFGGEPSTTDDPQTAIEEAVLDLICGHEDSEAVEAAALAAA
jgi:DNA topoisomerase I